MKKLIVLLLISSSAWASKTTLTGTLNDAQGNLINGMLVMQLPVPAQDTTNNTIVTNTPVFFRLLNGAVTGGAQLYDTATLQPLNLYYMASAYDTTGTKVFGGNFNVTGATYNLGAAIPTSVTTSNVNYAGVCTSSGCGVLGLNLGNNQLIFGLGQITAGLNTGYDLGFTSAGAYRFGSNAVNGWTAGLPTAALDTGLSRCAAGVTCAGNGTLSDASGTLEATNLLAPGGANLAIPTVGTKVVSDTATQTLSGKTLVSPKINTGIANNGTGFQHVRAAGCTTAAAANAACAQTINWPMTWADTSYTVACNLDNVSGGAIDILFLGNINSSGKSTTQLIVTMQNVGANAAASTGTINCIGIHD